MMSGLLFAVLCLGWLGPSSALLEPIPFPAKIRECYDYRSNNVTASAEAAMFIQNMCYREFLTGQMTDGKVWSGENLTKEGINYIDSLFRRIIKEAEEMEKLEKMIGGRQKRQTAPSRRLRREVRSPGAFQPYVNCILRLQTESVEPASAERNTYQTIAAFHSGNSLGRAHNGPAFLPWHRIYLLLLETECNAAIPYWDSGLDHDMADPTSSILWGDQFFGNGDGEVSNGPFRNMRTILNTPIIRNYGTGNSALFTKEGLRAVLSRRRYEQISEPLPRGSEFSLEGHHNGPHVWVGGHMAALNSATWDPVFFTHHAYVDAVWARFRARQTTNPETDYPRRPRRGHRPNDVISFGNFFERVTNLEAMSNRFARLTRYEQFSACENNCNNSPHLFCDQTQRICISRIRPNAFANSIVAMGASRSQLHVESLSLARAEGRGPLPVGEKFSDSPFVDERNSPDTIGTARASSRIRKVHRRVKSHSRRRRYQRQQQRSRVRVRRSISQNATIQENHFQSVSSLERSFTNTFVIDGVVDIKRWVYMPVRVLYTRSSNARGTDPTLSEMVQQSRDTCKTAHSGAFKVFISSNGLNYYGIYSEYAIVDNRQPVYSTTISVGVKNPEYGEGEVLFTSYDSCGRPCRPMCLTSVNGHKYRGCSGAFKISTSSPQMYSLTYKDALNSTLVAYNPVGIQTDFTAPSLTFVCDTSATWPWVYQ